MASFLDDVVTGSNWKLIQIFGTGNATNANYITFELPVEIRRAEAVTSIPAATIAIFLDRNSTGDAHEQVPLIRNCPLTPASSVIHPDTFSLHLPQLTSAKTIASGGKIYLVTTGLGGGDSWMLTVEAKE